MNTPLKSKRSFKLMHPVRSLFALAGALLMNPGPAQAHPGHSLGDSSLSHIVTSPYHIIVLTLIGVALIIGGASIQRPLPRLLLRGCGVLALMTAGVYWGLGA